MLRFTEPGNYSAPAQHHNLVEHSVTFHSVVLSQALKSGEGTI